MIGRTPYRVKVLISDTAGLGGYGYPASADGKGGKIEIFGDIDSDVKLLLGSTLHEILEVWMAENGCRFEVSHPAISNNTDPSDCRMFLSHSQYQRMCDECARAVLDTNALVSRLWNTALKNKPKKHR